MINWEIREKPDIIADFRPSGNLGSPLALIKAFVLVNLLKALSTVSGMTLVSRITGLVRESLQAILFGAGLQMDAFQAAFRLPNILRRMFAEGAFSQAFVPILAEYQRQRGDDATRDLVGRVGGLLALVLLGVTVLGVLAAPALVYLLASGFAQTPGKIELTTELIRIVFPYILFVSLVSLAGSVLNVYRRFAVPAFTRSFLRSISTRRSRRSRGVSSSGALPSLRSSWHPSRASGCCRARTSIGAIRACEGCC